MGHVERWAAIGRLSGAVFMNRALVCNGVIATILVNPLRRGARSGILSPMHSYSRFGLGPIISFGFSLALLALGPTAFAGADVEAIGEDFDDDSRESEAQEGPRVRPAPMIDAPDSADASTTSGEAQPTESAIPTKSYDLRWHHRPELSLIHI